jgi:uncharacterized protein YjbJ (UPF0337 family)
MNWDHVEGNWRQFKGIAKEEWGKLTDEQLERIDGDRDFSGGPAAGVVRTVEGRGRAAASRLRNSLPRLGAGFNGHDAGLNQEIFMKPRYKRPKRLVGALVIGLAVPAIAAAATMTSIELIQVKDRAGADYKAEVARCATLSGNQRNVCSAEVKATEIRVKSEAEAKFRNTDKARRDAQDEIAAADYSVAKARCDARAGNVKDACLKKAKASETKAKAGANAAGSIAIARQSAGAVRSDDLNAALEKCNPLADAAKVTCVANAKAGTNVAIVGRPGAAEPGGY